MRFFIIALVLIGVGTVTASTQSPYLGEELNEIKSLSLDEINGLLQGEGMGFAKAAELNQYPGPKHVLDLAKQLHLSNEQIAQTNQIFEVMHKNATSLGAKLVEYEKELDSLFSSNQISATTLDTLLLKIGETRAKLRGTHLHAHLEMKQVLNHYQIMMYDDLRGYNNEGGNHEHSH